MERSLKTLHDQGIKVTHHRLEILKYLYENHNHPTADMIYTDLKKTHPSLSKTTVYNTVDILEEHGVIQSITLTENEKRFDVKTSMHHHFLCKKCGEIIDIDIECPNIGKVLEEGHQVQEVHGYFKGICKECLKGSD